VWCKNPFIYVEEKNNYRNVLLNTRHFANELALAWAQGITIELPN
jgi:hypothetical protein